MISTLDAAKMPSRAAKKRKHKTAAEDEVEYIGTHREYDDEDYEGPRTRGKQRRLEKKNRMREQKEGIKKEPKPRNHVEGECLCPVCWQKIYADRGCKTMLCRNESGHPDGQWVQFCGHCLKLLKNSALTLSCGCKHSFGRAAREEEVARQLEQKGKTIELSDDEDDDDDMQNAFVSESSDMEGGRDSPDNAPPCIALKVPYEADVEAFEGEATATNEGRTDLDLKSLPVIDQNPDIVSSAAYHEDTDTEENYSSQDVKLRGNLDDNQLQIKKEFNEDTDEETEFGIFGADNSDEVQSKDDTLDDEDSLGLSTRDKSEGEELPLSDEEGRGKRKKKRGQIDLTDVPTEKEPILSKRKGTSKYQGVSFDKTCKKWVAKIWIDGTHYHIGFYDNEEEAGIAYARAVFKYKVRNTVDNGQQQYEKINLTGVPKVKPILSNKKGTSKYKGVTFHKTQKQWRARIEIDGNRQTIGYYDNEEEAAVDYARAVFKYRAKSLKKFIDLAGVHKKSKEIDLTGVPKQLPIKSDKKDSSSQYKGVSFYSERNKWVAMIQIGKKQHYIGSYDNEEKAAVDYATAVFKYKKGNAEESSQQKKKKKISIDLSDVPMQLPIRSKRKGSNSKYKGVYFDRANSKWMAKIWFDGKKHHIGSYVDEENAGSDYARAVFKYKAGNAEESSQQRKKISIDLTDVPKQPPIKSEKKGSSSQYKGVTFMKNENQWVAQIKIDGKLRYILAAIMMKKKLVVPMLLQHTNTRGNSKDGLYKTLLLKTERSNRSS